MTRITLEEEERIYALAEKWVGSCHSGRYRREVIVTNVERRMQVNGILSVGEYINFASEDPAEKAHLISSFRRSSSSC